MKRTLLLGSAWTASAAAAVGLGFLAISLVDASASDGGQVLPASATTSAAGSPAPSSDTAAPVAPGQQVTAGGTVYGSCDSGSTVVASAPAAGWWLDDSSDPGEVEFENGTLEVEVRVTCVDGVAQFSVEGPRTDDSGSGRDDGATSAPSARTSSSGDDSDGRVGGGHGSDDGVGPASPSAATPTADDRGGASGSDDGAGHDAGDDSRGRDGGGHGSDD